MGSDNPATVQDSEAVLLERTVEAALSAWRYPDLRVVIDSLVDMDRGYFRRLGLIDRAFNPSIAARVLRHVQPLLAQLDPSEAVVRREGDTIRIQTPSGALCIDLARHTAESTAAAGGDATHHCLLEGTSKNLKEQI